jgi:NADH-quinone oxidoreductase subunit L
MKWTSVTFSIGALALCGIMPLSGFFSKDLILDTLWKEHHYAYFGMALFTALLTAFYMTRLWIRVFHGDSRNENYAHAHESDAKMVAPMVVLAVLTILSGITVVAFGHFMGSEAEFPQVAMASVSTLAALIGIGIGWAMFGEGRDHEALRGRHSLVYQAVSNKYYLDVLVDGIAYGYLRMSEGVNWFDRVVINGVVNGVGVFCRWSGRQMRLIETGKLQTYQRLAIAGALLLAIFALLMKGV